MNEDVTSDPGSSSLPITIMSGIVIFRQYRLHILLPCVRLTENRGNTKRTQWTHLDRAMCLARQGSILDKSPSQLPPDLVQYNGQA